MKSRVRMKGGKSTVQSGMCSLTPHRLCPCSWTSEVHLTAMPSSSSACQTPPIAGPNFKGVCNFNLGQNTLRTTFGAVSAKPADLFLKWYLRENTDVTNKRKTSLSSLCLSLPERATAKGELGLSTRKHPWNSCQLHPSLTNPKGSFSCLQST